MIEGAICRKDLLDLLPVPGRIKTYLNTPFYYSEQVKPFFQFLIKNRMSVKNESQACFAWHPTTFIFLEGFQDLSR